MSPKKVNSTVHEETKKRRQDLKVRLLSTTVMVIVLIGYLSTAVLSTEAQRWGLEINVTATNYIFFILSAVLTGTMGYEVTHTLGIKTWWKHLILIAAIVFLFIFPFFSADSNKLSNKFLIYETWNVGTWYEWWQSLIFLILFVVLFCVIAATTKEIDSWLTGLKMAGISLLIILGMKGFTEINLAMTVDEPQYGFVTIIWIWGTIIATDSIAYLGGTRFGKHKLAPSISPKKSWEGAIIGGGSAFLLGSLLSLLVFYLVPNHDYGPIEIPFKNLAQNKGAAVPGIMLVLLTLLIVISSTFGDLLFSAIKRSVDVKDFSKLIPGHGGILDRLDSFILTFFIFFIIVQFI